MHHASRHHEHTLVFHLGLGIVPLLQQAVRAGRLPEVGCTDGVPLADPGLATHTQAHRLEEKLFLVRVRNAGFEGALIVHLCPCCAEPGSVVLHEFNGDVRALMRWAQTVRDTRTCPSPPAAAPHHPFAPPSPDQAN